MARSTASGNPVLNRHKPLGAARWHRVACQKGSVGRGLASALAALLQRLFGHRVLAFDRGAAVAYSSLVAHARTCGHSVRLPMLRSARLPEFTDSQSPRGTARHSQRWRYLWSTPGRRSANRFRCGATFRTPSICPTRRFCINRCVTPRCLPVQPTGRADR